MSEKNQCPQCGAATPAHSPQGLCPHCLLKWGLESQNSAEEGESQSTATNFATPTPEEIAIHFPDLEILELVGRGGMGVVYKARQKQLNRLVALKILAPKVGQDPAFSERFAREARAMAILNHPHIVAVYDFGQSDGLYYFLMEYVDGLNLRRLLESGKLAPEEALAIVPQICDALQYAHDHGVVHRDIKPENLLLDKEGRIKIADFGIAKLVDREASELTLTGAGQIMGTPQYMAPEQIEHPLSVDHRADIYSLGVVFYQMLTGELPIGRFAPPSQRVQIDVRLDEVVLRALEKEPEHRYQQVSEMKTEVESIPAASYSGTSKAHTAHQSGTSNTPSLFVAKIASIALIIGILVTLGTVANFHFVFGLPKAAMLVTGAVLFTSGIIGLGLSHVSRPLTRQDIRALLTSGSATVLVAGVIVLIAAADSSVDVTAMLLTAGLLIVVGVVGLGASLPRYRRDCADIGKASGKAAVAYVKSKTLRWFVALICILIAFGLVAIFLWNPTTTSRPVSASSPPSDPEAAQVWNAIQLVGVCPDGGDELLDAQGNHIGKHFAFGPWNWDQKSQARSLIFDIPQSTELLWDKFPGVRVSSTGKHLGVSTSGWTADHQGKQRRFLSLVIDRTYQESGMFLNGTVPIDRIDVTLEYYLPGRGKAACTFMGPFEVGKPVKCQEGLACTLTPTGHIWPDGRGAKFHISAVKLPLTSDTYDRVLVYDINVKGHIASSGGGSMTESNGLSSAETDFELESPLLSRIASITIGETPQEKTFQNILIRYPGRPARNYPEYLDQMASALGLTGLSGNQLAQYNFKNSEEALKVVDIVRGRHVEWAWQAIRGVDFAELPQDVRDKLRSTAKVWADNGLAPGIEMGLKGQWPEFVAPAFKVLATDSRSRSEIADAMQYYRQFTPQDLEQIAVVLEQRNDPRGMDALLYCLKRNRQRPGGQEALMRLACSDKVWLWWPAVKDLTENRVLTMSQLTRDLQVKYLAETNPENGLDPALAEDARTLLAKLPTAELAAMSISTMFEVMRSVAKNLPREKAQATFLDLLQDKVDHWEDYQFEGYSVPNWWPVDRAVRYLNSWNNLNLGGVGSDVNSETSDNDRIDWPDLAKKALAHFGRKDNKPASPRPAASRSMATQTRRFTLVDALNQPIPNATLDLHATGQNTRVLKNGPAIRLKTDSNGRFTIDWPAGKATRQVWGYTGKAFHSDYGATPVVIYGGDSPIKVLLVKKDSPQFEQSLKGQVLNSAGQPVAGALVESNHSLMPPMIGEGKVFTDLDGRFVMYLASYSEDEKNRILPADAKYEVVARAPEGLELFPTRAEGQSPMSLVLSAPTLKPILLRFEVGDDQYAQGEDFNWISLTFVSRDKKDSISLENRYITDVPVRLVPGQYRAKYHDGRGRSFEFVPVDIDENSPEVVTFRRPAAVTYSGQVLDGITGEPMADAFVFTYDALRGKDLAMLFEQDWKNLAAMPERPSIDDPGVKSLGGHYSVEAIVRSDAKGYYEIARGQEQRAGSLIAFAKDCLPRTIQLSKLIVHDNQAQVPAISLFPAAYIKFQPEVPAGNRVSVCPQWEYQTQGQPDWFKKFRMAMEGSDYPPWLELSGPVRAFVPAGVSLKLRFETNSASTSLTKENEQVLKLSQGETKDLGVIEFVPQESSAKPLNPNDKQKSKEKPLEK